MQLQPCSSPKDLIFYNLCGVSPQDFAPSREGDTYLLVNGQYVVSARPHPEVQRGQIGLNEIQRQWMGIALTDIVDVEPYDPFRQGKQSYLGNMDVEIGFATRAAPTSVPAFDQDELADHVTKTFQNQVFAPGQSLLVDVRVAKLKVTIKTVELGDLASLEKPGGGASQQTNPQARGILIPKRK